jgi:hypothetical protein
MVSSRCKRGGEGPRLGLDAGIEERDLLVQELDVAEQTLEHERVVVGDAADQRLPQLHRLLPQESPRQYGQVLQDLLDPIGVPGAVLDQLPPGTGQLASSRKGAGGTKLARSKPCSTSRAIHWQSLTAVFRPGTVLMGWALTRRSSKRPSSIW